MQLDQTILTIGARQFSLLELCMAAGVFALILLIITAVLAWRGQRLRQGDTIEAMRRTADLEHRLSELLGSQVHISRTLDERLDQVSHRIGLGLNDQAERTGQSLRQLHERLAVIDSAQKNLVALSSEMVTLKDILSNKQARGAYGQARMEAIVRDGLHTAAYSFQASLSNGTRPDCLIKLPDSDLRLVIDAKFPLEAFNALKQASGEAAVKAAESRLRADVLRHVKDISEKYLIAGETHESAIMFVPSEAVYADLYEHFEDVIQKAHRVRVVIASPNVLMLLIQTMQAIFKDQRMREQAGLIKVEVTKLLEDVTRLKERVGDLQKHFGAANSDLEKLNVSADKINRRGLRIESLDLAEEASKPAAIEPRPRLVERG